MANSNARVSQSILQVLHSPPPISTGRVSQNILQILRSVEADYSISVDSARGIKVAQFQGVKNITIASLPYAQECTSDQNFAQSVNYPTLITASFKGLPDGGLSSLGTAVLLTATTSYTFSLNGDQSSIENIATPCMFGEYLLGSDKLGNFWCLKNTGTYPNVNANIIVSQPPLNAPIFENVDGSDMQMIACNRGSRLGLQMMNAYGTSQSNATSVGIAQPEDTFWTNIAPLISFLVNPGMFIFSDLLSTIILSLLFGKSYPARMLVCGFLCDWTKGPANGSLALQNTSCLGLYNGSWVLTPWTTYYRVPFAQMGGDPDLYIGRHGQVCVDFTAWNSFQFWTNNSAFGIPGALIYDFNNDIFNVVSLDDVATDTIFQDFAAAGGAPVATPQGWVFTLPGSYGLNPATLPILVSPDWSKWWLLNFIPSDSAGTAMLSADETLQISADTNGFYVGTPNNDYQYSTISDIPLPALPGAVTPQSVGCMNLSCNNTNPYDEIESWT